MKFSLETWSTFGSSFCSIKTSFLLLSSHSGTAGKVRDCSVPLFWVGTWIVPSGEVSAIGRISSFFWEKIGAAFG